MVTMSRPVPASPARAARGEPPIFHPWIPCGVRASSRTGAARRVFRLAALAAVLAIAWLLTGCSGESGPQMSAPDAFAATAAGELTLIDIRTPREWRQTGVPEGAWRIDMLHPGGPKGFVAEVRRAVKDDAGAPIALICRTGNRSARMQRLLLQSGFTNVVNVGEGVAGSGAGPGWIRRGLPMEPYGGGEAQHGGSVVRGD